jgi:hypothetical protein
MHTTLRLRPGEDDDIIAWLEQQPNKSEAMRECMRRGITAAASPLAGFTPKPGEDDDVIAWLEQQADGGEAIREAVRRAIASEQRSADGDEETRLRAVVTEAVCAALADMAFLRAIVTEAVREALADATIAVQPGQPDNGHQEDPELAARLDSLFDDCA